MRENLRPLRRLDLHAWSTQDRLCAARHEAGHAIVADHFGEDWNADIWYSPSKKPLEVKLWAGRTRHFNPDFSPLSRFRSCVVVMGGPLAELLADEAFELDCAFEEIESALECGDLSETDMAVMRGHHQPWRACNVAFGILSKCADELARLTELLRREKSVTRWQFHGSKLPGRARA